MKRHKQERQKFAKIMLDIVQKRIKYFMQHDPLAYRELFTDNGFVYNEDKKCCSIVSQKLFSMLLFRIPVYPHIDNPLVTYQYNGVAVSYSLQECKHKRPFIFKCYVNKLPDDDIVKIYFKTDLLKKFLPVLKADLSPDGMTLVIPW